MMCTQPPAEPVARVTNHAPARFLSQKRRAREMLARLLDIHERSVEECKRASCVSCVSCASCVPCVANHHHFSSLQCRLYDSHKVVASRHEEFICAFGFIGGMSGHAVERERGLNCLRHAANHGCAAALAVLCADDDNLRVRQCCFNILRFVDASKEEQYPLMMQLACKTVCARMCERNLVTAPADYDYVQQYRDAVASGSQFSMVYYGAVLQRDGKLREAATHYGKSARLGFAPAKFLLARCLRRGEGVRKDDVAATRVMSSAAKQLYPHAMVDEATTMMKNDRRHDAKAFAMLNHVQKNVNTGGRACAYLTFLPPPNPHNQLVLCYAQGRGVRGNHENALQHLALSLRISELQ